MELELMKEICETIIKVLYGRPFNVLPAVKSLQYIENKTGIVLEFKHHFRYLVPQIYGWELVGEQISRKVWSQTVPDELKVNWSQKLNKLELHQEPACPTYYELYREIQQFADRKTYENIQHNIQITKHAESICQTLFDLLVKFDDEIESEEEYLERQSKEEKKRDAVLTEIWSQCDKKLYEGIARGWDLPDELVENVIENRIMKCEATQTSGDSGLTNVWEEVCVQMQLEQSCLWEVYLETIDMWIKQEFEALPLWKRNLIWLNIVTENYEDEIMDERFYFKDDVKDVDVEKKQYYNYDDVAEHVKDEILERAANYRNEAIEKYIEDSFELDD